MCTNSLMQRLQRSPANTQLAIVNRTIKKTTMANTITRISTVDSCLFVGKLKSPVLVMSPSLSVVELSSLVVMVSSVVVVTTSISTAVVTIVEGVGSIVGRGVKANVEEGDSVTTGVRVTTRVRGSLEKVGRVVKDRVVLLSSLKLLTMVVVSLSVNIDAEEESIVGVATDALIII